MSEERISALDIEQDKRLLKIEKDVKEHRLASIQNGQNIKQYKKEIIELKDILQEFNEYFYIESLIPKKIYFETKEKLDDK